MNTRLLAAALAVLCLPAQTLRERLQVRLDEIRQEAGFTGMTAGVVMSDGTALALGSGVKATARMLAGSTGKTFAAAVILKAVDEGKLDLDSPISRWLGKEPWFEQLPNARGLTLRLLLSHRSGVNDYVLDAEAGRAFSNDIQRNWSARELAGFTFGKPELFPAGEKFAYADANFVIAGLVYETVTGRKLFSEVDRMLLKPFRLEHTVTSESRVDTDLIAGRMSPRTPFKLDGSTMKDGHLILNAQFEYAGGGIISTGGDLARWARLLWEGKAFSPAMLAEVLDAKPTGTGRGGGRDAKYGLAVQVQPSELGPACGHAGWFPGYQTEMVYFPEHQMSVAVQVNQDPGMGSRSPRYCLNELARTALAPSH
jgi:D-alanyl-D-alanine carboxypeptidase